MKSLYIFDIDGTIALCQHRRHFVEAPWKEIPASTPLAQGQKMRISNDGALWIPDPDFAPNWDAFYDACDLDLPNWPVLRTLNSLYRHGHEIWFFSGRADRVRNKTESWIFNYTQLIFREITNGQLVMRREGDYTPDDVLKQQFLDAMLPCDRERLVAVFDDRQRVVDMWRRNGIACFQVASGDF